MIKFLKFGLIGAANFILELLLFNLCVVLLNSSPEIGKIVGAVVTIVTAYFANKIWVFKSDNSKLVHEAFWFVVVNLVCLVLTVVLYAFLIRVDWLEQFLFWVYPSEIVHLNVLNVFSIGVMSVIRFIAYHFVVFHHARPSSPTHQTLVD